MVTMLSNAPRTQRVPRRPAHPFQLETRPWQIQPFMIAPVLPGETLKNLLLQSRVVSDPLKNALVGWHKEYYFFYIKHRDLDARDTLVAMMLEPSTSTAALNTASNTRYNHYGTAPDWVELCLKRVVEEYFRDEGETWNANHLDSVPLAKVGNSSWLDSASSQDIFATGDFDVDGADANTTVQASEVAKALQQWELLRTANLTNLTYEEWLGQYGVHLKPAESHIPELVRYVRSWTYPSNTVDPSTGVPSSAVSWSIQERADKDRFFKEPGFLLGVTVARPKVYLKNMTGNASSLMADAYAWLPVIMSNDPATSYRKIAQGTGPLQTFADADGYWVDIKDLLLYGDQFLNFAKTTAGKSIVDLPSTTLAAKYASSTDADGLFNAAAPSNKIREDGIVTLNILGHVMETSPGGIIS